MKQSKFRIWYILAALVLVLAAVIWFFCTYSVFSGRVISRRAQEIDLRGQAVSAEEIDAAAAVRATPKVSKFLRSRRRTSRFSPGFPA